ncbi:SubName: Full=Uncharacterized protein {ECO:0000313/EMBL:CCA68934.1} [Serendipita indica DSM 11827]|nr:SubName: Full=Uncharacterized protein {ECO:0000313/EMBL:CCA68934.1} [Serendipita indica DSM 11827]
MSTNLPDLLSRCSALYELRLVLEDVLGFGERVIEDLKRTSPPILALRIRDGISGGSAVRELLQVWPTLKHLSLRSTSFAQSAPEDDEPSPPFHLYEFRWEGIRPLSVQSLLWLLNYDQGRLNGAHLRVLHLASMPENDHDGELASYYGRFLHSLRIPHPNRRLLESAQQIRELVLFDHKDITRELLRSLPPEVQHIAFSIQDFPSDSVENILMMRDRQFLKNLRVISVYRQSIKPWPVYWDRLVARAEALGILMVRQEHRGLLVGGTEDLVATTSFPRRVTIRQFDRMAAAVNTLPAIYTEVDSRDQGFQLLAPPERSRESLSNRSGNSGSRNSPSTHGHRTIHLDEPSHAPRQWDYVYDKPLEPIKLDDPVDLQASHQSRWGTIRRSIDAFKTRVKETRAK